MNSVTLWFVLLALDFCFGFWFCLQGFKKWYCGRQALEVVKHLDSWGHHYHDGNVKQIIFEVVISFRRIRKGVEPITLYNTY